MLAFPNVSALLYVCFVIDLERILLRTSAVSHKARGRYFVIHEDFLELCAASHDRFCSAAVLQVFVDLTDCALFGMDIEGRSAKKEPPIVRAPMKRLWEDLCGCFTAVQITTAVTFLINDLRVLQPQDADKDGQSRYLLLYEFLDSKLQATPRKRPVFELAEAV